MPTLKRTWSEFVADLPNPPAADDWATQEELDDAIITGGGSAEASEAEAIAATDSATRMSPRRAAVVAEKYDVRRAGAAVNGSTDDTAAWASAVTTVAAAAGGRGGTIWLPPGDSVADNIELATNVGIEGAGGSSSRIMHRVGRAAGTHLLTVPTDAVFCRLENFTIHGNRASQTTDADAIHFTNAAGTPSLLAAHIIRNVKIENVKGTGLYLGPYLRRLRVENVDIYYCDTYGMYVSTSDSFFDRIDVAQSGGHGIYLHGASALQISNAKSWLSGRILTGTNGHGWYIHNGNVLILTNVVAQEVSGGGFFCYGQSAAIKGLEMNGAIASNGNGVGSTWAGFTFNNVSGGQVRGQVRNFAGIGGTYYAAATFTGGTKGGIYDITYSDLSSWPLLGTDIGAVQINLGQTRATPAYSGTYTPNPYTTNEVRMTLTGNITINPPGDNATNHYTGARLRYIFTQNGTGGHAVTWDAEYKVDWTPDTAANAVNVIEFECVGSTWVQIASAVSL